MLRAEAEGVVLGSYSENQPSTLNEVWHYEIYLTIRYQGRFYQLSRISLFIMTGKKGIQLKKM